MRKERQPPLYRAVDLSLEFLCGLLSIPECNSVAKQAKSEYIAKMYGAMKKKTRRKKSLVKVG